MPTSPEGIHPSPPESSLAYTEAEKAKQDKLGYLQRGQRVSVKRKTSGKIESDWMITGYNDELDRIVVMKGDDVSKPSLMRMYTREELESWNPQ
jgi:hypothetical protein